jgi:hypothetical protein
MGKRVKSRSCEGPRKSARAWTEQFPSCDGGRGAGLMRPVGAGPAELGQRK